MAYGNGELPPQRLSPELVAVSPALGQTSPTQTSLSQSLGPGWGLGPELPGCRREGPSQAEWPELARPRWVPVLCRLPARQPAAWACSRCAPSLPLPVHEMGTLSCIQMSEIPTMSGNAPPCLRSTSLLAEHATEVISCQP